MESGVRLGYNHRGIEKACEERTYIQDIYLIERICGICSHSHSTCFVQAVEEIAGLELPKRALYIRTLIGRAGARPQPPAVAGRGRARDRLRHAADVHLARPRGGDGPAGRAHRQPRQLRHEHHRRRAARHHRPSRSRQILKAMDVLEERTKYYIEVATRGDHAHQAALGRGRAVARGRRAPGRRRAHRPGLRRRPRRPQATTPTPPTASWRSRSSPATTTTSTAARSCASGELMESLQDDPPARRQHARRAGRRSRRRGRSRPARPSAATRRRAARTCTTSGPTAPTSPSASRSAPRRWPTSQAVAHMLEDGYLADLPIVIAAIDPCFSCTDRLIARRATPRRRPAERDGLGAAARSTASSGIAGGASTSTT